MRRQHVMRHPVHGMAAIATISLLILTGCQVRPKEILEAPAISCKEIILESGNKFNLEDYFTIEPDDLLSYEKIDTGQPGEQTVTAIVSNNGSFTIRDISVTITEKPQCPENSVMNSETGECECTEGYELSPDGCVIKTEEDEDTSSAKEEIIVSNKQYVGISEEDFKRIAASLGLKPVHLKERDSYSSSVEKGNIVTHGSGTYIKNETFNYGLSLGKAEATNTTQSQTQPKTEQQSSSQQTDSSPTGHGTEYFMPSDYGGFDQAFDACVIRCKSMSGACECVPTDAEDGYVLNY